MKKNFVKKKLRSGKPSIGTWIEISFPEIAEIMGNFGFDWFVIDMEHAPHSYSEAQMIMQAMAASQTLPFIRVPCNDIVAIKKSLDIGSYGVVIPWVNTKEDAINAVKACIYPQKGGLRGTGPRRALNYGFDQNYFDIVDEELLIVVQIETEKALKNLEDIFSTDGVDAALVGPWDLSMSLGVFKQMDHPKMISALEKILDKAQNAGVAPGIYCSADEMDKYIDKGFLFNSLMSDTELLIYGCTKALEKVHKWNPKPLSSKGL